MAARKRVGGTRRSLSSRADWQKAQVNGQPRVAST
jgi:hypothetical protein